MARVARIASAAALALALGGCKHFDIRTPSEFNQIDESSDDFAYRATSPDGVVSAVRVIELPNTSRGNLGYWVELITLRLRKEAGYALLESRDVATANGVKGRLLRFGHDENGKPYDYSVGIFWTPKRLFLLETGGRRVAYQRVSAQLDWQRSGFKPDD